jgi:hypothetical protein
MQSISKQYRNGCLPRTTAQRGRPERRPGMGGGAAARGGINMCGGHTRLIQAGAERLRAVRSRAGGGGAHRRGELNLRQRADLASEVAAQKHRVAVA